MNEVRRDEILGIRIWISLIVEERWKMFDEFQVHSLTSNTLYKILFTICSAPLYFVRPSFHFPL